MLDVVGDLIPFAVGVALSPLPLIAVLLVLGSSSPRAASAFFLVGRYVTVAAVALLAAFAAGLLPEQGDTPFVGAVLRIVLGVVLIGWAVHKTVHWAGGRDQEPELPGWMASIQGTTPAGAARLAVILSIVNVKEIAFGVGAGLTIGTGRLGPGGVVGTSVGAVQPASPTASATEAVAARRRARVAMPPASADGSRFGKGPPSPPTPPPPNAPLVGANRHLGRPWVRSAER